MNKFLPFKIIAISFFFAFVSCSKDSEEPTVSETSITTEDFSKTMDENPADGQVIGTVKGSTNDGAVTFSIIDQTPAGAFAIDATTGEIAVANASLFNYETTPIIIGSIKVANGAQFEIADVTITLKDVAEDRVFEGDIYLRTQQEIDDFGKAGYTHVTGFLVIGSSEYNDITDLSPLVNLEKIDDYLGIWYCQSLLEIDGLNNLTDVGSLTIYDNTFLTSITGFKSLKSLNGSLYIQDNYRLTDMSGFSGLEHIGETLEVGNNALTDLSGLQSLKYVGTYLSIYFNLSLLNIDGLSNLRDVGESITIANNDLLQNLNGLSNVQANVTKLQIENNPLLTDITGVLNIDVTEKLTIDGNPKLTSLEGLSKITHLNDVVIRSNTSLKNFNGLEGLTAIANDFKIERNYSLKNLDGLVSLGTVGGIMEISDNLILRDFCGIRDFIINGTLGSLEVSGNLYNPSKQNIIDGNCSI